MPANVSYDAASRTSRLAPLSPLSTSTLYTATVSGATDLAGNVISPPVTWSFTTSATAAAAPDQPVELVGHAGQSIASTTRTPSSSA